MSDQKIQKLRIAIDGNEANVLQRVGSNAYAFELLCAIEKLTSQRDDIEVTVLLSGKGHAEMPPSRKGWQYQFFGPSAFWTQFALPLYLFWNQKKYDLFYTPGHYAPRVSSVPYISSVMDLAFLHFPKQFKKKDFLQLKEWTRYSVQHAKKVIAISEATKKDVIENYRLKPEKIVLAYPGIDLSQQPEVKEKDKLKTLKKWKITQPYIVYVGTLQPRKNLVRLIEAFESLAKVEKERAEKATKNQHASLPDQIEELQLVIVGKVGWLANDILEKVKNSPLKNKIILTGFVTDMEKAILFEESLATVLVGLYEGFGIPALEAMAYQSIPIVSETTSLPEVVGSGGIYVDPYNVESIAGGILDALSLSSKERGKLLRNGRNQVKKFTWKESAEVILETIEEVAKQKTGGAKKVAEEAKK